MANAQALAASLRRRLTRICNSATAVSKMWPGNSIFPTGRISANAMLPGDGRVRLHLPNGSGLQFTQGGSGWVLPGVVIFPYKCVSGVRNSLQNNNSGSRFCGVCQCNLASFLRRSRTTACPLSNELFPNDSCGSSAGCKCTLKAKGLLPGYCTNGLDVLAGFWQSNDFAKKC